MFKPPENLRRWLFCGGRYSQYRHLGTALPAAVENEVRLFEKQLQYIGILRHRDPLLLSGKTKRFVRGEKSGVLHRMI
jgi:hypothetical protein